MYLILRAYCWFADLAQVSLKSKRKEGYDLRRKISFWSRADKCGEELVRDENMLDKKWVCSGRGDNYDDLIDKISANEL